MNKSILQSWLVALDGYSGGRTDFFQEGSSYCPLGLLAKINGFDMQPFKAPVVNGRPMLNEYAGKVTDSYSWPKTVDNWPCYEVASTVISMNSEKMGKKRVYSMQDIARYVRKFYG